MLPSPTAAFYKSLRSMTISTAKSFARYHIATTYGWGARQFACLDDLWTGESHWNFRARNGSSGAYGIPQALPGNKMSIAGNDWRTNPVTQIAWGTRYIKIRYSSPCSALNYEYRNGSY